MKKEVVPSPPGRSAGLFRDAVEDTPDVKGHCQPGLKALGDDSRKMDIADSKHIGGSLDIDTATKKLYPEAPRWDYAVAYKSEVYFIEVHPAFSCEVTTVIHKLLWLKKWLEGKAPSILKLQAKENPFRWVYTGRYAIAPTSRYGRLLAQYGIKPTATCRLG